MKFNLDHEIDALYSHPDPQRNGMKRKERKSVLND
jgi:hypothetical protein